MVLLGDKDRVRKFRGQDIDISLEMVDVFTIQAITPVDTGELRDGFFVDRDGTIKNFTFYGDWVEKGTSKMRGRWMVARSIPQIGQRMARKVGDQIDRAKIFDLPKRR